MRFLWLAVFGLAGIFARFGIDEWVKPPIGTFPVNTFAINILGSGLAGVVYVLATEHGDWITPDLRTGLMVGFLGGFTTFSAFSLQTVRLFEEGQGASALAYACLSPGLGVLAAFAGLKLTRLGLG